MAYYRRPRSYFGYRGYSRPRSSFGGYRRRFSMYRRRW